MNLEPQTTERLIGMVSSMDKENRVLAYGILNEYFTHLMFSFKRNIGYLLLIHKHMIDEDEPNQINFTRMMDSHAPSKSGWYTYSEIVELVNQHVKHYDKDQRRMVYEYACKSMRQTLKIDE